MRVEKLGEGEPKHAVVGSIHGDEPCGKKVIERFLNSDIQVKKPLKLVIANEEALEKDKRYLEADLNRSFPGDLESDKHEERLAAKILEEVKGMNVLDLHTTRSHPEPFATLSHLNEDTKEMCRKAGVENAVYFSESNGTLNGEVTGIVVETGLQGSDQAVENGFNVLLNYLAAEGIIEREFELSDPNYFKYYETVEGDWEFKATNFDLVKEGTVFAKRNGEELVAEESFYPILMSNDGYEGMLGFKAEKMNI
ncbi:MAG: succinylglutamate desuccinylase/aspartoacylase family protein [Nanohaloarchaea archaeon]|nr:succinylglutamate desuccinylase/aspartoacylase family protein [Candidatus Nanohaloarchaea archaeon]